jgi:hypothetical protein
VLEATDCSNAPECVSERNCAEGKDFEEHGVGSREPEEVLQKNKGSSEDRPDRDGNTIDTQDIGSAYLCDDRDADDGGEEKYRPAPKKKKRKNTRPRPRAQDKVFGPSDAIALLDAFCDELVAADGINDSKTLRRGWTRDLQRIEDRVATFRHHGGVRRGIEEARECLAESITYTGDSDSDECVDWCGTGFCWDRPPRRQEGRLPADSRAAAQTADEASKQKHEGNEALMAGLLDKAIQCYDAAQKTVGAHCMQHMDCGGESRADLLSISIALSNNIALASLRLAECIAIEAGAAAAILHYNDALFAASEALVLDASNVKAKHRAEVARLKVEELRKSLDGTRGEEQVVS